MAHFGSNNWNNPCGTVFQANLTGQSIPSGTVSSTTISGTTYTAERRGLYRVMVNMIVTTGTTGTFTPQIVSQDEGQTLTSTLGGAGATPATNTLYNTTATSSSVSNHNSLSKSAYVVLKQGGTLNLAYTTTGTGSGGVYNVYMTVHAV